MSSGRLERRGGVFSVDDGIAEFLTQALGQRWEHRFVLGQENGLGAGNGARRSRLQELIRRYVHAREVDLEGRASADFAVDPDVAARLLHDAIHRREAEAGTLALFLCRE